MRSRSLSLLFLGLALAGCSFKHDPDTERFSCARDADCGDGHVCVTQKLSGKGVCFLASQCTREVCNGKDDDCDGVVDDVVDAGSACATGLPGACSVGTLACTTGPGLSCVASHLPQAEACDGSTADLNCNGLVGCADPECEGTHACGAGCVCRAGAKVEINCANGIDDDGNGLTDCDDPACRGQPCGGGGNCGTAGPHIGDGGLDAGPFDGGALDGGASDAGSFDGGTLDGGLADAGAVDGGTFDGGAQPQPDAGAYCAFPETVCDNGLDDDGDGRTDCADSDCLGLRCNADGGTCLADGGCR